MERISLFNYESFYLDYLEGNLNEEDTALLMAFLKDHPECEVEDEELVSLTDEEFVYSNKDDLKQTSIADAITLSNIEFFLISKVEGLLSNEKLVELDAIIAANNLSKELGYYQSTQLKPNLNEVYSDKAGLKQRKVIVLWPYITSAAAAAIAIFIIWGSGLINTNDAPQNLIANDQGQPENIIEDVDDASPETNTSERKNNDSRVEQSFPFIEKGEVNRKQHPIAYKKKQRNREDLPRLEKNKVRGNISTVNKPLEPVMNNVPPIEYEPQTNQGLAIASTGFEHMNNPIKPLTNIISKKTNTEVDFKTAKTTKEKPGGFYLKIGKFEVSRKKH